MVLLNALPASAGRLHRPGEMTGIRHMPILAPEIHSLSQIPGLQIRELPLPTNGNQGAPLDTERDALA